VSKAYGYVRVSTRRQADSGVGLEAQRRELIRYATGRGIVLSRVVVDEAVSGKTHFGRRRAGAELNALLEPGDQLFLRLDRGFRSHIDAVRQIPQWIEGGVVVHLIEMGIDTSSVTGKAMYRIMASLAQMQVDRIRERALENADMKRDAGQPPNGVAPYGWTVGLDGIRPHPTEGLILGECWNLKLNGGATWGAMAARAAQLGGVSRTGKPWNASLLQSAVGKGGTRGNPRLGNSDEDRQRLISFWLASLEPKARDVATKTEWVTQSAESVFGMNNEEGDC